MPEFIKRTSLLKVESLKKTGVDITQGAVAVDNEKCNGCGLCISACPGNTLEFRGKECRMIQDLPFCMSCGDCAAICPECAIEVTGFLQFHKAFRYLDRGMPEKPRKF